MVALAGVCTPWPALADRPLAAFAGAVRPRAPAGAAASAAAAAGDPNSGNPAKYPGLPRRAGTPPGATGVAAALPAPPGALALPPATVAVAAGGGDATGVRLATAAARAARWAVGPERVDWRIAEAKI